MLSNLSMNRVTKVELQGTTQSTSSTTPLVLSSSNPPNNDNNERRKSSTSSAERYDLPQEIVSENFVDKGKENELHGDGKINTPKKRSFFDLNKISSISPSRFSLNNLTPILRRKSVATSHKLSQLEQQSNLFIRDGSKINSNEVESMESGTVVDDKSRSSHFKMPSDVIKSNEAENFSKTEIKLCTKKEFPNYEEIDIESEPPDVDNSESSSTTTAVMEKLLEETNGELNSIEQQENVSAPNVKEMLKHIPVRPRKSAIPHMENYLLFDPDDFYNDKKLRLRNLDALQSIADFPFPIKNFCNLQAQQKQQPHNVYDISEHDERLIFHNYYEIDPELMEEAAVVIDHNRIEENPPLNVAKQISSPSHLNSESVGMSPIYTSRTRKAINQVSGTLQDCDGDENVITIVTATGAKRKSLMNQTARNSMNNANQQQTLALRACGKSNKINLPFDNGAFSLDPLKSSHSLPQLQTIGIQQRQFSDGDYNIEINKRAMIQLRKKSTRTTRPLSTDSGLVTTPTTTPSPPNEISSSNQSQCTSSSGDSGNQADNLNNSNLKSNATAFSQCDNVQQMIEIYTEWANYYLVRSNCKRKVVDLSTDARDGLLLAQIVEAVTNFKVPDLIKKPKNQQQAHDNVERVLSVLRQNTVPGIEQITANDIVNGRLKSILSLFFSLSRYKQASKVKDSVKSNQTMLLRSDRQLPVYTKTANGATAIPLPATVLVTRRCPPDKVRPLPPTPNHQSSIPKTASGSPSNESSRPNSPPDGNAKNGIRGSSKIPYSSQNGALLTNVNVEQQQTPTKQSMLGKLKLFSSKDKSTECPKTQLSKRTSSSSGFSSARSERSDSSLSLNNETSSNIPTSQSSSSNKSTSTKKSESTKVMTKISKVPAPAMVKTKGEKRDKSQLNNNNNQMAECNNDGDISPTKVHKIPQAKLQVPVGRKSADSKTGLQQQQAKSMQSPPPSVGTGIPKPMAAIKGTTKQILEVSNDEHFDVIKVEKVSISMVSSNNNNDATMQKTQIVNPLHNQLNQTNNNNSTMSDSINSNNQSIETVVYRSSNGVEASLHTDIYQLQTSAISNRNDPYNGNKFGTMPTKVASSIATTIIEEDKEVTSTMVPMRPLMRGGFNNHMSSPSRLNRVATNGYYDENGQGYCSDGDSFRKTSIRYSDIENGYLSEGPHFLSLLRNRPQMPSTIAEERSQSSREGNLDSADMESNSSRNSRDYWGNQQAASPTSSRKDKTSSPSHSRRSTPSAKSSSRTKGVPQNFGYIKRTNGSSTATEIQTNAMLAGGRAVAAMPRSSKLKVSGGTQTDFQQKQLQQNPQYRSFSLTGANAQQLSQSVKERFGSHSLPKGGLDMHVFQQRMVNRGSAKINDGSLSDTQAYSEMKPDFNAYAMWLKNNNRLSEGDSLETVSMISSPGLSRNAKLIQSRDSTSSSQQQQSAQNAKINRSNSIRSTKSEKMYPSVLSRAPDIESEPFYCLPVGAQGNFTWSQPTSPQPTPSRGFTGLLSPTHNPSHRLTYPKKNDEVHGSQISLMSGASSMYGSTTEEQRQANEVRRLRRELTEAKEQVFSLSSQLSTNAHVVSAFEQSLQNMTNRLQQLTATTEKKESEITEMRQTIELLRKTSALTSAHMQSMGVQVNGASKTNGSPTKPNGHEHEHQHHPQQQQNGNMQRQHSTDSMCSVNSNGSNGSSSQDKNKKKKGWLRSSFTKAFSRNAKISKTNRQTNLLATNHSDSKSSLPPTPQKNSTNESGKPPASPTKSSPHRYIPVVENAKPIDSIEIDSHPLIEDLKKQLREKDMVLTDIRLESLTQASQMETLKETVRQMRQEMMNLKHNNDRLQRMVVARSLAGSEASLGCPASPSGDARRYSLANDNGSNRQTLELPQHLDETEEEDNVPPAPAPDPEQTIIADLSPTIDRISLSNEILTTPAEDIADPVDGKKICIAVFLGQSEGFSRYSEELNEEDLCLKSGKENGGYTFHAQETIIAYTYISGKTTWQNLDYIVRKTFKDYLSKVDPGTNLGLNTDSIISYHLGEAKRGPEMGFPELLPCGYIIGDVKTLYICLQGVGSLAFDSLIPRSIVHRYINLLTEHRRLILCGPKGTGKSYLAHKLAEFLVAKANRSNPAESIATFNIDHKSSKELKQYLSHIAEQASTNDLGEELPEVIILDNLHHASETSVFSSLLSAGAASKLPFIICTMSQATCNTSNLQLHHNFRWVLTANHMEPVKGFLGRYLRRRLFHHELLTGTSQMQMEKVFKWLPSVWHHINTFLENHSSSDVTIGPNFFLQCPLNEDDSQKWFVDLWNHQLAPYLVDAIKEGIQLYGRRGNAWIDPCVYVRESYPWKVTPTTVPTLRQITADDVGLEAGLTGSMDSDPLLNMLQMLQQAANDNADHDNSDCASLDSNFTHESAGTEQ